MSVVCLTCSPCLIVLYFRNALVHKHRCACSISMHGMRGVSWEALSWFSRSIEEHTEAAGVHR